MRVYMKSFASDLLQPDPVSILTGSLSTSKIEWPLPEVPR